MSRDGFLAAIREQPEDDTHRLVFADWLEEHGDEADRARAEFIRLQVELERSPPDAPGRTALEDRADNLLTEFEERWLSPVPAHLAEWAWRRGFLDAVHFAGPGAVDDAATLAAGHPLATLNWRAGAEELLGVLDHPDVASLPPLHLNPTRHPAEFVEALAARRGATTVSGLSLMGRYSQDGGLAALAALPCAAALTSLVLMESHGPALLADLVAGGAWPRLEALRAYWVALLNEAGTRRLLEAGATRWRDLLLGPVHPDALPALADLTALRRLALSWAESDVVPAFQLPPGLLDFTVTAYASTTLLLALLAETPGVERLRQLRLRLRSEPISPAGWDALGRLLGRLPGPVLSLEVRGNDEGNLAALLALPHLDRLAGVTWWDRAATPDGLEAFFACPRLIGLRELTVATRSISKRATRLLAEAPWLSRLRSLDLSGARLGSRATLALLESPGLRPTRLNLNGAALDARTLAALEAWPGLGRVRNLTVNTRGLGGDAAPVLRLGGLSPLASLHIVGAIRDEDRQRLRERHGRRMWS